MKSTKRSITLTLIIALICSVYLLLITLFNPSYPLKGNWYKKDKSHELILSFHDDKVIFDYDWWKYEVQEKDSNNFLITLRRNKQSLTLNLVISGNEAKLTSTSLTQPWYLSNAKPILSYPEPNNKFNPKISSDSLNYKGFIDGYSPKNGSTGTATLDNIVTGKRDSYLITISSDGSFNVKIPLIHPQMIYVRLPQHNANIFCEPGQKIFNYFPKSFFTKKNEIIGESARLSREYQLTSNLANDQSVKIFEQWLTTIDGLTPDQYKNHVLRESFNRLKELDKLTSSNKISQKIYKMRVLDIKYMAAYKLINYNYNIERAYRKVNKPVNAKKEYYTIPVKLNAKYFDYIKNLPLNNSESFVSTAYSLVIDGLKNSNELTPSTTIIDLITQLRAKGQKFIPEDEITIQKIERYFALRSKNAKQAELVLKHDKGDFEIFSRKYAVELEKISQENYNNFRDNKLKDFSGVDKGLVSDLLKTRNMASSVLGNYKALEQNELNQFIESINNPTIGAKFVAFHNSFKSKLPSANTKGKFNTLAHNKAAKVYESITKKYRGKVLYLDFWATWCMPCRQDIEVIAPLKDELKDKNIVFISITDESSPLETYTKMIPNIAGEHFRLKPDEWNQLKVKFNIEGIPHHVIVNKQSKVVNNDAHLNNDDLRKKLLELECE